MAGMDAPPANAGPGATSFTVDVDGLLPTASVIAAPTPPPIRAATTATANHGGAERPAPARRLRLRLERRAGHGCGGRIVNRRAGERCLAGRHCPRGPHWRLGSYRPPRPAHVRAQRTWLVNGGAEGPLVLLVHRGVLLSCHQGGVVGSAATPRVSVPTLERVGPIPGRDSGILRASTAWCPWHGHARRVPEMTVVSRRARTTD